MGLRVLYHFSTKPGYEILVHQFCIFLSLLVYVLMEDKKSIRS